MATQHKKSFGEVSTLTIMLWLGLGFLAYWLLPLVALDYGITDSTLSEFQAAVGWRLNTKTLIIPLSFVIFAFLVPFRMEKKKQGWLYTIYSGVAIATLFVTFVALKASFGLGALIIIMSWAAIFSIGVAKLGYQRGDTFISGAVILVIFIVSVFIFFPIGKIFQYLIFNKEALFDPFQFFHIISAFGVGKIISNTLMLAFSVGAVSTLFGLMFALYAYRATTRLRSAVKIFYILPMITPPFVVGMALILLFGRAGLVNDGLMWLFGNGGFFIPDGSSGIFEKSGYIYGFAGIFLAQVLTLTPISYMVISGMLSSINPAMEEASLTMRADRFHTLWHVTLPLLKPSIANAFLLSMVSSAADFGNPLVLGGEYDVLSTEIYFAIAGAQLNFAKAAALGLILLLLSLFVFYIQKRWIGKKSYVTVTGVETAGNITPLPKSLQRIMTVIVLVWFVVVGAIYLSIFTGGFVRQWGADYTFTLAHHVELWFNGFASGAWPSFINSLTFSMISAPLTAILGILIAYILTRQKFFGREIIDFGTILIFAIPGTVMGVAYILAFNTYPMELTGTAAILIITMSIRAMPVGIRGGISALSQISKSLEEASLLQRAGNLRTIISVLLPLLKSTIVSAMGYSFIRSMTTVSAVIFLATAGTNVATTYILGRVESGDTGPAVAYGSVLILTMLFFTLIIEAVAGKSKTDRQVTLK